MAATPRKRKESRLSDASVRRTIAQAKVRMIKGSKLYPGIRVIRPESIKLPKGVFAKGFALKFTAMLIASGQIPKETYKAQLKRRLPKAKFTKFWEQLEKEIKSLKNTTSSMDL